MERDHSLSSFSDDDLLRRLSDLLGQSRRDEADLVAHIGEVDRRRLYAREASPSMFAYCTEVLHLSEAEAYLRIAAARAAREHPLLLTMLADGRLHLTAIAKLAPHLTPENREDLLKRAAHRSKREIEELVAEISPRTDAPAVMRKLPDKRAGTTPPTLEPGPDAEAPARTASGGGASIDRQLRPDGVDAREPELRPDGVAGVGIELLSPELPLLPASPRARSGVVEPLAPGRYKVQFTASAELHDKLERLRALMRPSVPDGDLAAIIEQTVTEKLQRREARRFARTQAPRKTLLQSQTSPTTRQIPAAVKRAVYERDGGRCRYEDEQGRRCTARQGLEYHHRRPFARAVTTRSPTSRSRADATTATWPRSTTAGKPWLGIAVRGPALWSRRRLPRRDECRVARVSGRAVGSYPATAGEHRLLRTRPRPPESDTDPWPSASASERVPCNPPAAAKPGRPRVDVLEPASGLAFVGIRSPAGVLGTGPTPVHTRNGALTSIRSPALRTRPA